MALYMLDTDTVMYLIRGKTPALDERIAAARPAQLCISAITRGELLCGLSRYEGRAATTDDSASTGSDVRADSPRPQRKRFGIDIVPPHTLEEVSQHFDIARERIRQDRATHRLSGVVDDFLARVTCLPWDEAAATHFAAVAAQLQRIGRDPGSMDMMIAGHAIAAAAILVTTREGEFVGVDGLELEDWTRSQ